ncbi:hypothetical protein [Methanohalobium evestigatum]|uniref:hypothetical protein n=1 Tax=Methanohalobium evestigatum TaxID=2322 RepID=UPI0018DAFDF5|nr:hypothetical protein [Methanohalobium evestigatum]
MNNLPEIVIIPVSKGYRRNYCPINYTEQSMGKSKAKYPAIESIVDKKPKSL